MLTYCVMYGIGFGLNYSTTPVIILEVKWRFINLMIICKQDKFCLIRFHLCEFICLEQGWAISWHPLDILYFIQQEME